VTCSGARSYAGLAQAAPVQLSYAVVNGFGGFAAPKPGSDLSKSAPITVGFQLTASGGKPITAADAAALAKVRIVSATLRGPGINATTAVCTWSAKAGTFQCRIDVPKAAKTGKSARYTITVTENFGTGFLATPTGKASNPETIHFR
jgi:hypothetical protein